MFAVFSGKVRSKQYTAPHSPLLASNHADSFGFTFQGFEISVDYLQLLANCKQHVFIYTIQNVWIQLNWQNCHIYRNSN